MFVAMVSVTNPIETTCLAQEHVPGYKGFVEQVGEISNSVAKSILDATQSAIVTTQNLIPGADHNFRSNHEWILEFESEETSRVDLCASIAAGKWVFEIR